jgi:hypothetical protein
MGIVVIFVIKKAPDIGGFLLMVLIPQSHTIIEQGYLCNQQCQRQSSEGYL